LSSSAESGRKASVEKKRRADLARAWRNKLCVKFYRPFEEGWVYGYLLDIGPQFFLLALINDEMRFNGFQCMRLTDVSRM
jgi:hypothetical protein